MDNGSFRGARPADQPSAKAANDPDHDEGLICLVLLMGIKDDEQKVEGKCVCEQMGKASVEQRGK